MPAWSSVASVTGGSSVEYNVLRFDGVLAVAPGLEVTRGINRD